MNTPKELISDGNGGHLWKGKMDSFQGYTAAKLDSIHEDIQNMNKEIKENTKMCTENKSEIKSIKAIAGVIGAVFGFIASGLFAFIGFLNGGLK